MPVLWCLHYHNSCNRIVGPGPVLHLRILLVWKCVWVASSVLGDKGHIFETVGCDSAGTSQIMVGLVKAVRSALN